MEADPCRKFRGRSGLDGVGDPQHSEAGDVMGPGETTQGYRDAGGKLEWCGHLARKDKNPVITPGK